MSIHVQVDDAAAAKVLDNFVVEDTSDADFFGFVLRYNQREKSSHSRCSLSESSSPTKPNPVRVATCVRCVASCNFLQAVAEDLVEI